ncbi:hypothetical protein HanRHA438_Chr06g0248331 [Helianthus annuus]|nr:hypothetical protein HanHA300_Chr06g0196061 [Helianthus annuus]KAJ0564914.1 hypothetical protein HanIR_Chr06g0256871 [Helianthus annuus]KAJ0571988.1 hypothetical protein HanHA89_Chr06g0210891 [Helianthus annuus]KAJ0736452.1 hypothetical protein HanLR1_Chr06g0196151 [Helianthus annuus]KAJ0910070.1 hypothetical protein HanRHA438_Chr06g0248331 [Helianthus annuus]
MNLFGPLSILDPVMTRDSLTSLHYLPTLLMPLNPLSPLITPHVVVVVEDVVAGGDGGGGGPESTTHHRHRYPLQRLRTKMQELNRVGSGKKHQQKI